MIEIIWWMKYLYFNNRTEDIVIKISSKLSKDDKPLLCGLERDFFSK